MKPVIEGSTLKFVDDNISVYDLERLYQPHIERLDRMIEEKAAELRKMDEQIDLMKKQLEAAESDSKFAKRTSIIAIIISLVALIPPYLPALTRLLSALL